MYKKGVDIPKYVVINPYALVKSHNDDLTELYDMVEYVNKIGAQPIILLLRNRFADRVILSALKTKFYKTDIKYSTLYSFMWDAREIDIGEKILRSVCLNEKFCIAIIDNIKYCLNYRKKLIRIDCFPEPGLMYTIKKWYVYKRLKLLLKQPMEMKNSMKDYPEVYRRKTF